MTASRSLPSSLVDRRGFTLFEVAISFALLGTFLSTVLLVLFTGTRAGRGAIACRSLEQASRRALERMASELTEAGTSVLAPDPTSPFGCASLTFQRVVGLDGDLAVTWSMPVRLALRLEHGELDDGTDDDGDGLVDEHELIFTADPGGARERSVVWQRGVREYLEGEEPNGVDDNGNGLVDERGLCFERVGARLTIRLTLLGADEGNGIKRTVETTLRLRN